MGIPIRDLGLDGVRPQVSPKKAILVALATGASLLLLAVSIFSAINEAKGVSARSAELQAIDEALRSAVIVRSQLATAASFAALEAEAEINSGTIVGSATDDADRSLDDLMVSIDALEAEGYHLTQASQDSLTAFFESGDQIISLLRSGDGPAARDYAIDRLVPEFDSLVADLGTIRESIADELESTDRQLGRLGNLASFVIAFLVPTIAAFVYQQMTRRSRETVTIAHTLESERTLALWRRALINRSLDDLGASPELADLPRVAGRMETVRFVVASTLAGHDYFPVATDLEPLLAEATADCGLNVKVDVKAHNAQWLVDPSSVSVAVRSAAEAAADREASSLILRTGLGDDGSLRISVADDGSRIDELSARRVLDSPMITELDHSDLGSTGLSVLIAQMVAEAHGGSVGVRSCDPTGRPGSTIELSLMVRSVQPTDSEPASGGLVTTAR